MKKNICIILVLLIATLLLASCENDNGETTSSGSSSNLSGKMKVHAANLSKDEKGILSLTQQDGEYGVFDYKADDSLKAVEVKLLEYKDNKWQKITSSEAGVIEGDKVSGRLFVSYKVRTGLLRTSWESGSFSEYEDEEMVSSEGELTGNAWMSEVDEEIVYNKEIPLAIIAKSDSETEGLSVSMEGFDDPKLLRGASKIRAIVVVFKDTAN